MAEPTQPPASALPNPSLVVAQLDYENFKVEYLDRLRYQVEFAQSSLRGMMLVNGGALIALFTFIASSDAKFDPTPIWWSFAAFSIGLAATVFAKMAAFFSMGDYLISTQYQMWNRQSLITGASDAWDGDSPWKRAQRWQLAAVGGITVGFVGFVAGSILALAGVLTDPAAPTSRTSPRAAVSENPLPKPKSHRNKAVVSAIDSLIANGKRPEPVLNSVK